LISLICLPSIEARIARGKIRGVLGVLRLSSRTALALSADSNLGHGLVDDRARAKAKVFIESACPESGALSREQLESLEIVANTIS